MILTTILSLTILGQVVLPGDNLSLEQAKEKAHIIAVGKITEMGDLIGVGAISFGSFEFEHTEVLKGKIGEKVLKRLGFSARGHEVNPTQDEEYLVFIEQFQDHVTVVKMLPKTNENIEATKKAIGEKKP